jgi:hypothetical protein
VAVIGPQNKGIPGYNPGPAYKPFPKPKVTVGPQNIGLPGYRPGDAGNPYPAPPGAPGAPPPAAPGPPPIDFSTLVGNDPDYIRQKAQIEAQNRMTMDALLKGFHQNRQGYQDNANSHGALFSGAAVNAQKYAAQQYTDQAAQQSLNYQGAAGSALSDAWKRILAQLASGGAA